MYVDPVDGEAGDRRDVSVGGGVESAEVCVDGDSDLLEDELSLGRDCEEEAAVGESFEGHEVLEAGEEASGDWEQSLGGGHHETRTPARDGAQLDLK